MASRQLTDITEARVDLCRVALLRDGDTSCIFAGRFEMEQDGNKIAVALGDSGHVVTCEIVTNNELYIGPVQQHTTLLHILCQFRLQLLLFLAEKLQKKSGKLSRIPRHIEQEHFGKVLKVILTSFPGLLKNLDHADMTPVSRLIQSMPTRDCLLNWLPLFERLVKVRLDKEPSQRDQFIRSVIDKLCLVDYPITSCCSNCTCEQEIFTTLFRLHQDIKTFAFRSAAKHGNFHLMDMFLRLHYSNFTPSFITPRVVSDKGEPNSSEPIIVYTLKSELCRRFSESQLVYLLEMLANVSRIDINEPDADGLNALFYAAKFKLRKPFHLLLNHQKFNREWRNPDGDSLEELFCWSGLDQNNPAAMIALRKNTGSRIGSTNVHPSVERTIAKSIIPSEEAGQNTSDAGSVSTNSDLPVEEEEMSFFDTGAVQLALPGNVPSLLDIPRSRRSERSTLHRPSISDVYRILSLLRGEVSSVLLNQTGQSVLVENDPATIGNQRSERRTLPRRSISDVFTNPSLPLEEESSVVPHQTGQSVLVENDPTTIGSQLCVRSTLPRQPISDVPTNPSLLLEEESSMSPNQTGQSVLVENDPTTIGSQVSSSSDFSVD